jgi:hypothetical protein
MAWNRTYFESITQKHIVPRIADAVFKGCPLAYFLRENHSIKLAGGRNIVLPIIHKEFTQDWYDGVDVADLEVIEPEQSAQFNWHWLRVMFSIPETDIDKNGGGDGVINILEARKDVAELSLIEGLSDALYGTNTSDSQVMPGLQDMAAASGTEYGSITDTDLTSPAAWLMDLLTPLTAGTLDEEEMRRMRGGVTRGASKPNLGTCNFPTYNTIWRLAQTDQRFGMEKVASIGFDHVVFEGMPIIPDEHASGTGYGTADSHLYFLNMDYVQLFIHENKAFASRVYDPLPQQNVYIGGIFLGASFTTNNRRMHAAYKTVNPSS